MNSSSHSSSLEEEEWKIKPLSLYIPEAASDLRVSTDGGSHYFWVNSDVLLLLLLSDSPKFPLEKNNIFGLISSCRCWVNSPDFKRQAETWKDINNNPWWLGYNDQISSIIWNKLVDSKTTDSDRRDEEWHDLKSGFCLFLEDISRLRLQQLRSKEERSLGVQVCKSRQRSGASIHYQWDLIDDLVQTFIYGVYLLWWW